MLATGEPIPQRTRVGIIGAGPAGLLLSHLLALQGIESVVLERRSRAHVERRIRAGVIEDGTRAILERAGVGERMAREGLRHRGINLAFEGRLHAIDLSTLTGGRGITVYGQQEVVKDLIAARLRAGGAIAFEVEAVDVEASDSPSPAIVYQTRSGQRGRLACDFVAGCDGSHGIAREAIPAGTLHVYTRSYPFAWLGILAQARPAHTELIYVNHPQGFALFSMRSPTLSRNYLQVAADERLEAWPDERLWDELQRRVGEAARIESGPILERSLTPIRSVVVEPMQYGRLFLAGDAAHVVPPTGAKGMNLAVADVVVLAKALAAYYHRGDESELRAYTATCLRHVWQAEYFSWWMTTLLHRLEDPFEQRIQRSLLAQLTQSETLARHLAENYVGLHTSGPYAEWVMPTRAA